ncbi:MAG: tripartite tricarboxylate transporter substrate binding protein, partial [Acetobacteraceae bacterium]|nr:tripartite tricarboxylate transporter substrate binding protein [Acetobacteraceae bacterium]
MKGLRLTRRGLATAAIGTFAAPHLAHAAWPERPLQLIVPFAAGGGTDISARTMAQFLERELGQPVVVQNRPGAGGEIGLSALADARP